MNRAAAVGRRLEGAAGLGIAAALLLAIGCNGSKNDGTGKGPKTGPAVRPSAVDRSACNPSKKSARTMDLNRDGRADLWKLYRNGALTCEIKDLNFDGRRDLYKHYAAGRLVLEEMDLDFDGKVDLTRVYQGRTVAREELDTNYDGKPDIWKHYSGALLTRVERDSTGNGRIDYWETYQGGKLARIGVDKNGDGQPDQWEDAPADETLPAQQAPQKPAKTTPAELPAKTSSK